MEVKRYLHHGLFLLILLGFAISKATHLDVPFFWDESWVYGPAVNVMADNALTLLPGSFPLEHSRGHPLLFHLLGAIWINIFGNSLVAMHAYALSISMLFICCFNVIISQLISKTVALASCALLVFQPIFYAQSSMVLPEVLLSFLCFLSLWTCYKKKWLLYVLFASLAIWTKESAVAFIICLTGALLITFIKNRTFSVKETLLVISPLLSFFIFMLCNKAAFGWYLYPEHTGMLTLELAPLFGKIKAIFHDIFVQQKRLPLTLLAAGSAIFLLARNTKLLKNDLLIFFAVPIVGFSLFSAINFYTVRYILVIFPLAIVLISWFVVEVLDDKQIWLALLVSGFMIHSIVQLFDRRSIRDIDLSYLDYGPTQLDVIDFMETNRLYDESIHTGFLTGTALTQKYGGYRNSDQEFTKVNQEMSPDQNYFIFSSLEPHHHRDRVIDHPESKLLKTASKGNVKFEIYLLKASL